MGFGPKQADITAIKAAVLAVKAKTDYLPASPANEATSAAIQERTDNLPDNPADQTTSTAIKDKTDNLPASPADEATSLEIEEKIDNLSLDLSNVVNSIDLWTTLCNASLTTAPTDQSLGSITIAGLPEGATVIRATITMRYRTLDNQADAENSLDGSQIIYANKQVGGTPVTGITFESGEFVMPNLTRESNGFVAGESDVSSQVPANGEVIEFTWKDAASVETGLEFFSIQIGLRIWFSI